MKRVLLFSLFLFFLQGCGYTPAAKFSRYALGEKISTNVVVSLEDPQNTVMIKDSVDRAVAQVFQASLVERVHADSHLEIRMQKPTYSPIIYDQNGYIVGYRMAIKLHITKNTADKSKNYVTRGFHDFSVAPNAIVTDQDRYEAIGYAAQKAIKAFVAQASAEGARAKQ